MLAVPRITDHCSPCYWYNAYHRICFEQRWCSSVCSSVQLISHDVVSPARAFELCNVLQGAELLMVSKLSVLSSSSKDVHWHCVSRIVVAGMVFEYDCLTLGTSIALLVKSKTFLQQYKLWQVHFSNSRPHQHCNHAEDCRVDVSPHGHKNHLFTWRQTQGKHANAQYQQSKQDTHCIIKKMHVLACAAASCGVVTASMCSWAMTSKHATCLSNQGWHGSSASSNDAHHSGCQDPNVKHHICQCNASCHHEDACCTHVLAIKMVHHAGTQRAWPSVHKILKASCKAAVDWATVTVPASMSVTTTASRWWIAVSLNQSIQLLGVGQDIQPNFRHIVCTADLRSCYTGVYAYPSALSMKLCLHLVRGLPGQCMVTVCMSVHET